jgi:hypothetical protein
LNQAEHIQIQRQFLSSFRGIPSINFCSLNKTTEHDALAESRHAFANKFNSIKASGFEYKDIGDLLADKIQNAEAQNADRKCASCYDAG